MAKTGYVYILTSRNKKVLYVGVTSDLAQRLWQHVNAPKGFVRKYSVQNLVYYESIIGMLNAINREKELKGCRREKKDVLINKSNPEWKFLNEDILAKRS